jgi:hypothetical protein
MREPEVALGKPPQEHTQGQKCHDYSYDPHPSRKSGLVLRCVLLYPGLPDPFVELWSFVGSQHNCVINYLWCILGQNGD